MAAFMTSSPTPVPEGEPAGRKNVDAVKFNRIAERVMRENGVEINDLHGYVVSGPPGMQRPANVHFTKEGSERLGRRVAAVIERRLTNARSKRGPD
jgi:lysophospholipase L1-like esterase